MKFLYFIGIDVSKQTFHAALLLLDGKKIQAESCFSNRPSGFSAFYHWLVSQLGEAGLSQLVICMEHTGLYDLELSQYFYEKGLNYSHRNPLEIKRSSGISRGKSDRMDARRIAHFIRKERDELHLSSPSSSILIQLHRLFAARELLSKHKRALGQHIGSISVIKGDSVVKKLQRKLSSIARQEEKQLKAIEEQIRELLKTDLALLNNYELLLSIPGIGKVNAVYLLITTRNFTAFQTWRQYAAYAGTAPFEKQSGSSLKRSKRVNHFANKKAKALLTTAAKVAKRHDYELKKFYDEKIQAGKHKFWVINAIRNKIISRAFAVIERQSGYKSVDQFCKWKQERLAV